MLRLRASLGRLKRSAFPPPELGLMISTPLYAGSAGRAYRRAICTGVWA